jgi:hypothetical protein
VLRKGTDPKSFYGDAIYRLAASREATSPTLPEGFDFLGVRRPDDDFVAAAAKVSSCDLEKVL